MSKYDDITSESLRGKTIGEVRQLYQKDLMLNRNRLEEAAQDQTTKFERWYNLMEELEADVADANLNLKRLKSNLSLKLRAKPADQLEKEYGVSDLKEGTIVAIVDSHKLVVTRQKELNKLKLIHGKLKGAVEAARQRKSMIRELTLLYNGNYWDKQTSKGTSLKEPRNFRDRG